MDIIKEHMKEYREKNKERIREQRKAYRERTKNLKIEQ
jgi:TRAP-type C4-dicarboxylate transport system substrate-binding protein